MVAHSRGKRVLRNFLAWAASKEHGWVERRVVVYFNIAGPVLGVFKVKNPIYPYLLACKPWQMAGDGYLPSCSMLLAWIIVKLNTITQ